MDIVMKDGLLTHYLNLAQTLLDFGFPITIQGQEYFQVDKIYMRAAVVRNNSITAYTPLGMPLDRLGKLRLISKMSESEILALTTSKVLNDLKGRKPLQEMLLTAEKVQEIYAEAPIEISQYLNGDDDLVELAKPVKVQVLKDHGVIPFIIMSDDLFEKGKGISSFEVSWAFEIVGSDFGQEIPDNARIQGSIHYATRPMILPSHHLDHEYKKEINKLI